MIRAWESGQASGVYNLGSGNPISHRAIAESVVKVARDAGLRLDADPIRTVPMPESLQNRFQFYTRAEGLVPWIAELTARPLDKMVSYWTDLLAAR